MSAETREPAANWFNPAALAYLEGTNVAAGNGNFSDGITIAELPLTITGATSDTLVKGGSVYLSIDVPDLTAAPIAMSGLLLGYSDTPHVLSGRLVVWVALAAAALVAAGTYLLR